MLTTHRTLHCFGWKNASLTECFLNLTDVGGKHCFLLVLGRRDFLMLAQFQPQHKCIDVENPNSFLSSSLSTNNTYLTPSSFLFPVCSYVHMYICMFPVDADTWGWYLKILLYPSFYLYTLKQSQSNTKLTNVLVLLTSLLWRSHLLLLAQAVLQMGYHDH